MKQIDILQNEKQTKNIMMQNDFLLENICVDTTENGPSKIWVTNPRSHWIKYFEINIYGSMATSTPPCPYDTSSTSYKSPRIIMPRVSTRTCFCKRRIVELISFTRSFRFPPGPSRMTSN